MRLLLLYLRSRQVPAALAADVGSVAVLWWLGQAPTTHRPRHPALLAVAAGLQRQGTGLDGADIDMDAAPDRLAATTGRTHVGGAIVGVVAATALTGDHRRRADRPRRGRDEGGWSRLGAATLGAAVPGPCR